MSEILPSEEKPLGRISREKKPGDIIVLVPEEFVKDVSEEDE